MISVEVPQSERAVVGATDNGPGTARDGVDCGCVASQTTDLSPTGVERERERERHRKPLYIWLTIHSM